MRTWTHKSATVSIEQVGDVDSTEQRRSKFPRLMSRPFRKTTSEEKVYWPLHLLPDIWPTARILVYGYDTKIQRPFGGPANQSTVYDFASNFLLDLEGRRKNHTSRPLILVAHSLGGIIVKEMLRQAHGIDGNNKPQHRQVYDSTKAVLFFGTPHAGSDAGGFARLLGERVLRASGFTVNEQILRTLLPSSERLQELRESFPPMVRHNRWRVYCFQEQYGASILNGEKVSPARRTRLVV